jgi:hypothetical protein
MKPIPLPSHIHYELLLQLLERQTIVALEQTPQREAAQALIATLRKALSQQKQLEAELDRSAHPTEYHWSLTQLEPPQN